MKSLLSQDQIGESTFSASILTQNPGQERGARRGTRLGLRLSGL